MIMDLKNDDRPGAKRTPAVSVLCVHGMWHGAWCWDNFKGYFEKPDRGYRLDPMDLRYHGTSEADKKALRRVSLSDFTEDVVRAARRQTRPLVMMGHSLGAWLIWNCIDEIKPDAVVLLAPASRASVWGATLWFTRHYPCRSLCTTLSRSSYRMVETLELAKALLFSPHIGREALLKHYARLQEESWLVTRQLLTTPSPYRPHGDIPVLLLGAEGDKAVSPKRIKGTAKKLGVQGEIMPGIAHDMMLDVAWETVAKRVVEWVEELKGSRRLGPTEP